MLDILGLGVDIADDAGTLKVSTTKEIDMNNADMPAMPTQTYDHGAAMQGLAVTVTDNAGLTKREIMAMHMMASIQASGGLYDRFESMAKDAVVMADALLSELDKKQ